MNTSMDTLVIEIESVAKQATAGIDGLIDKLSELQNSLNDTVKASSKFSKLQQNINDANNGTKTSQKTPKQPKQPFADYGSLGSQFKDLGIDTASLGKSISFTKNATQETKKYRNELGQLVTVVKKTKDGLTGYKVTLSETAKATKSGGSALSFLTSGLSGTIVKIGLVAAAIKKTADVIGQFVVDASSYYESLNLFSTTLGENAQEAMDWVNKFSDALYLDPANVMQYMGSFNSLIKGLGVGADDAYLMSQQLTQLTYDLASFKNLDFETAFQKLQSGISGEIEPLRNVGVALSEATLEELAFSLGIEENVRDMSEAEKAQLRYIQIMKSSTEWQADMGKTLMSPANALRVVKQQFSLLGRAIGNVFIPIVMALIPIVILVTEALTWLANVIADFLGNIFGFEIDFDMDTSGFETGIGDMTSGLEEVGETADETTNKLNTTLAPFDELNNVQTQTQDKGSGAGDGAGVGGGDLGVDLPTYDALSKLTGDLSSKIEDLKKKFMELGSVLGEIWNSTPIQAFVGAVGSAIGFVGGLLYQLAMDTATNMLNTWNNIKGNVMTGIENMSTFWTMFWTDIQIGIQNYGPIITEQLSNFFNTIWSTVIDPAAQIISQIWADLTQSLVEAWGEHGAELVDLIGKSITDMIDIFQNIYNRLIEPIITPLLETISWLWDEHISKWVNSIMDFVFTLIEYYNVIYQQVVKPIIDVITKQLSPTIAFAAEFIIGMVGDVFAVIGDVISGIIKVLTGVLDFLIGVFTGDWKRVWEGVKKIFNGVWEALTGVVKGVINGIITALNSFIAGINKIKFDVPDWVPGIGGQKWGFNIKKIPKLEDGGYPDADLFMANENGVPEMVGRIGSRTAVANTDQITTAIASAVTSAINNSNFGGNGQTIIYLGNKKLYEGYGQHVQRENDRYGTNMIRI